MLTTEQAAEAMGMTRHQLAKMRAKGYFKNAVRRNPESERSALLYPQDDIDDAKARLAGSVANYDAPHMSTAEVAEATGFTIAWVKRNCQIDPETNRASEAAIFRHAYKHGPFSTNKLRIPTTDVEAFMAKRGGDGTGSRD